MPHLLVLIPDRLSDLVQKGEVQPRYYNPGEVFDRVTILSTTADQPDLSALQYMVGGAKLAVRFYPDDLKLPARRVAFLQRRRLEHWARRGVDMIRALAPDLMRCHGADWATFLASRAKRALSIPYLVSLHINPDVNAVRRYLGPNPTPAQSRQNRFYSYIESEGLRNADLVMPVYQPILPYLQRLGVSNIRVCYNVLNGDRLRRKQSYALHDPPRMICVGRLLDEKDPAPIIRAVAALPRVELLIVGDGPKRPALEALVASLDVSQRVRFVPAIANDALCAMLPDFDLFVVHTEYWELNKSVLEALLTGLPVIINRRRGEPVPELAEGDFVRLVDNSDESYRMTIAELLADGPAREDLGRRAYAHAQARWSPAKTEKIFTDIYRSFLSPAATA